MKKQLFAILMFALAIPIAYAAPPDQLIAYTAQNEQIEDAAHQKTPYKFETTPAVMLVPAGKKKLSAPVPWSISNVVVRGDHVGTALNITFRLWRNTSELPSYEGLHWATQITAALATEYKSTRGEFDI